MTATDGRSAASEAYRTLRTNIQFMTMDELTQTILVVGAHPGCGKTTTVVNLGLTLAQAGSAVLLVDADLRRPKLHKIFKCKNFFGLTTMLIEENLNINAARHKTLIPDLDVIPSGPVPPNPAELLASRKMRKAIREFKNRYDYIILDSPPMMHMADASILAQLAEATLVVVSYGETTREELQKIQKQLELAKANVIGGIINGTPRNLDPYGYYGYYQEEPVVKGKKKKKKKQRLEEQKEEFDFGFDRENAYKDF